MISPNANFSELSAGAVSALTAGHVAEAPRFSRQMLDAAWDKLADILSRNEFKSTIAGAECGLQAMRFEVRLAHGLQASDLGNLLPELNRTFGKVRLKVQPRKSATAEIEVPIQEPLPLPFNSVLLSAEWQEGDIPLPLPLGWEIGKGITTADLTAAPHLLITGDGKTEKAQLLYGIASSLALKQPPHLLNFIAWDPTGLMKPLQKMPHFTALHESCITMLEWLEREKHHRQMIIENAGKSGIDEYNAGNPERPLPRIVAFMLDTDRQKRGTVPGSGISDTGKLGIHIVAAFSVISEQDAADVATLFPWRIILKNSPVQTDLQSCRGRNRSCSESSLLLGGGDLLFVTPDGNRRIQAAEFTRSDCRMVTKTLKNIFNRKYFSHYKNMNDLSPNSDGRKDEPMLPFTDAPQPEASCSQTQLPIREEVLPETEEGNFEGHAPIALDALKVILKSGETTTDALALALEVSQERAANLLDELTSHEYLGFLEPDGTRNILFANIPPEYLGKQVPQTRKDLDSLYQELKRKIEAQDTTSRTVVEYNKGVHAIGKKIIEEAGEVWMSAEHEAPAHTAEEISQLLYHLVVLMLRRGLTPEDIYKNL